MTTVNEQIIQQIPRLRRYARGLTGNKEKADDLVQDCLTRGLSKISLWKRGSNLQGWLFTIMHNIFVNDCQKAANKVIPVPIEEQIQLEDAAAKPDQVQHTDEILKLLANLKPKHREVLLLVAVEGMSYDEVSAILGVPKGTVMSRLHRARESMRQQVTDIDLSGHYKMSPMRRIK